MIGRSDGRLGQPDPTGPVLDHVCPICEGDGDPHSQCVCDGLGVVTAELAASLAANDPDPRWAPRPLPPVPEYSGKKCSDCAFRSDSLERDGKTAEQLFDQLALGNARNNDHVIPFWCHQGMHHADAKGYEPRQRAADGSPIGHPICAGWVAVYELKLIKKEQRDGR